MQFNTQLPSVPTNVGNIDNPYNPPEEKQKNAGTPTNSEPYSVLQNPNCSEEEKYEAARCLSGNLDIPNNISKKKGFYAKMVSLLSGENFETAGVLEALKYWVFGSTSESESPPIQQEPPETEAQHGLHKREVGRIDPEADRWVDTKHSAPICSPINYKKIYDCRRAPQFSLVERELINSRFSSQEKTLVRDAACLDGYRGMLGNVANPKYTTWGLLQNLPGYCKTSSTLQPYSYQRCQQSLVADGENAAYAAYPNLAEAMCQVKYGGLPLLPKPTLPPTTTTPTTTTPTTTTPTTTLTTEDITTLLTTRETTPLPTTPLPTTPLPTPSTTIEIKNREICNNWREIPANCPPLYKPGGTILNPDHYRDTFCLEDMKGDNLFDLAFHPKKFTPQGNMYSKIPDYCSNTHPVDIHECKNLIKKNDVLRSYQHRSNAFKQEFCDELRGRNPSRYQQYKDGSKTSKLSSDTSKSEFDENKPVSSLPEQEKIQNIDTSQLIISGVDVCVSATTLITTLVDELPDVSKKSGWDKVNSCIKMTAQLALTTSSASGLMATVGVGAGITPIAGPILSMAGATLVTGSAIIDMAIHRESAFSIIKSGLRFGANSTAVVIHCLELAKLATPQTRAIVYSVIGGLNFSNLIGKLIDAAHESKDLDNLDYEEMQPIQQPFINIGGGGTTRVGNRVYV